MRDRVVAVSDCRFSNLDIARAIVEREGAELRLANEPTTAAILAVARDAEAMLVTIANINAEVIGGLRRCEVIVRFGIGVDNVDIAAATNAGIFVCNVPDYCVEEVSDHTLALLLTMARKIAKSSAGAHAGEWGLAGVRPIRRLRGVVLGLVGFGRIAQAVARKAQALGIRVVVSDPFVSTSLIASAGVTAVSFDELLSTSDYVSIHAPLVPETHHLFDDLAFGKMKRGAYLINTARGPIVDEAALARALDQGLIAGAGVDVTEQEPPAGSPLLGRADVLLTPHVSFYSIEAVEDLERQAAEEVTRVLCGQPPRNPVNPQVVERRAKREPVAQEG